ncbi:APO protein 3, mitochondrial-like [Humulus lupulus]|uniref:APO protein 3, mitochondrial-like n=1 Tax=Humulus lupulus TaxID=3486 RepID=UPI002B400918|nr:APO protein 3, mitochondrial-like [Humulus lupulus]XP_062096504.1 APO protein 3, mitochondrial-like [Humulus lupulus]
MFRIRVQSISYLLELVTQNSVQTLTGCAALKHSYGWYSAGASLTELPQKLKRTERKPLVKTFNELKREARLKRKERDSVNEISLHPPDNGLLVKGLIPVAHKVLAARSELLSCVSRVANSIAIYSCRLCEEVHVGHPPHKIRTCDVPGSLTSKEHTWTRGGVEHVLPVIESFHLYDRIGRAVSHNERLEVDRIPAIVELCVQAGVDMLEHPTRRRTCPVYSVSGRIVDFEKKFPKEESLGEDIHAYGFWERKSLAHHNKSIEFNFDDLHAIAARGMEAWEAMRYEGSKLMEKYVAHTCGYCSEVQVGPKGHRVRNCQAFKHQMRDGQHAWQAATIDDIVPPVYVWHVKDFKREEPLEHSLSRYYGKLPAVVELFARAGARVDEKYTSLMREDVAVPELDEVKLVV